MLSFVLASLAPGLEEVDAVLLACTPVVDGRIAEEEWQPVGREEVKGHIQWEPGTVHFTATVAEGEDVVLSLDAAADGWLNGSDNREVRVRWEGGSAVSSVRTLDATGRQGPVWREGGSLPLKVVGAVVGGRFTVEGSLTLGRTVAEGREIGCRLVGSTLDALGAEPYMPRKMAYCRFGFDSVTGADGVTFWTSAKLREVAREDGLAIRFNVRGPLLASTAVVRAEGSLKGEMTTVSVPVSAGGTFEYTSPIGVIAPSGWRVLVARAGEAELRTSFKVSDLVEIEAFLPDSVEYSAEDRSVKGRVELRSTGVGRVEGRYDVQVDPGWSVKRGGAQSFLIYNPLGRERINLDLHVPGGSRGEFPVTFNVTVGAQTFTSTAVVEIKGP